MEGRRRGCGATRPRARWHNRTTGHPFVQVIYGDGPAVGEWQTGDLGLSSKYVVRITPSMKGRQRFTVTGEDRTVDGFWLANVFRKSADSAGDLTVRLTGNGVNETLTLPATSFPQCGSCSDPKDEANDWAYFSFGEKLRLARNSEYILSCRPRNRATIASPRPTREPPRSPGTGG